MEKKNNSNFRTLFIFYVIFSLVTVFTKAVLPPYFLQHGLSINEILMGTALSFLGVLLLYIFKVGLKLGAKVSWFFALLTFLVYVILIININSVPKFYIASSISGFSTYFFFIHYNVAYFRNTIKEKVGSNTAIMFSVSPIISIIVPLIAGILASISYVSVFVFVGLMFLAAFISLTNQKSFQIKYSIINGIKELKATRLLILLEGIWEAMVFGIIPIYTLFYIKTPLYYGAFIAYLSLAAVIANLTLGRATDKYQTRSVLLYPISLSLALITFLFCFVGNSIIIWMILAGLVQFIIPLFWNISTALVVDHHQNLELAMPTRDGILSLGRVVGLFLAFVSFELDKNSHLIFVFLALVMVGYLMQFYIQKRKYQFL